MERLKHCAMRQSVLGFKFGHRHAGFIVPSHRLLQFRRDDLPANHDVPLAQEPEHGRRSDAGFGSQRPGAFAALVALYDLTDFLSAESRRKPMDLELGGFGWGIPRDLGESQFPQSIRGQGEIRIV